ncbi:MAG: hypothetical protein SGILL_006549 [Bacillariaceae sp.]
MSGQGLVNKPADVLNRNMQKFLPELASEYSKYPMHHSGDWCQPNDTGPKGEPCYIPAASDNGIKMDYVFCKKAPAGYATGYYSLMTQAAYANLYIKLQSNRPTTSGCGCSKADRQALDDYDDCKQILWARQSSPKPDDTIAAQHALSGAKDTANRVYHATQNEQLVINAATTAAFVARN